MSDVRKFIEIGAACDLCGKCADVCPFGALIINEDSDIMFKPNSCVGECEVCSLCCPREAITYSFLSDCNACKGNCDKCNQGCKGE